MTTQPPTEAEIQRRRAEQKQQILQHSLFLYVVDHLTRRGYYDQSPLPDEDRAYSAGMQDIGMFSQGLETEDVERITEIFLLLKKWIQKDDAKTERKLYRLVSHSPMALYFRPLASLIARQQAALPFALLDLAQQWLYTAAHRQVLYFSYLLCALFGLEQIRSSYSASLYQDLFTLARCEEFTPALCLACIVADERPQRELWATARVTRSWGNVLLSALLDYDTPEKKEWILKRSVAANGLWPEVGGYLLEQGNIQAQLESGRLRRLPFVKATQLIMAYTATRLPHKDTDLPYLFSAVVPPPEGHPPLQPLLEALLRAGEAYTSDPTFLADLRILRENLSFLAGPDLYGQMDPNEFQLLLGRCDALLYRTDHCEEIRKALAGPRPVRQELVFLAQVLELDVWDDFYAYYDRHPRRLDILRYLADMAGPVSPASAETRHRRCHLLFGRLKKASPAVFRNSKLLRALCSCLSEQPGEGVPFLVAALRNLSPHVRWMAVVVLLQWPHEALTSRLQTALTNSLLLPGSQKMQDEIHAVLRGYQDTKLWHHKFLSGDISEPGEDQPDEASPAGTSSLLQ